MPEPNAGSINARELLQQAERQLGWAHHGAAQSFEVTAVRRVSVRRIELTTEFERRSLVRTRCEPPAQPAKGEAETRVDSVWDAPVPRLDAFSVGGSHDEVVAGSAAKTECVDCKGSGRAKCKDCSGARRISCSHCLGSGKSLRGASTCPRCGGYGHLPCPHCELDGKLVCIGCSGMGMLWTEEHLKVQWYRKRDRRVIGSLGVPEVVVDRSRGEILVDEEVSVGRAHAGVVGYRSAPITIDDQELETILHELLAGHHPRSQERVQHQRVVVERIPVIEVHYRSGGTPRIAWIHGIDRRVHAPEYPFANWIVLGATIGSVSVAIASALAVVIR